MIKDSLGDRMKEYEKNYDFKIPKKHPVIIRLDGRAFHTLTRGMKKPFDLDFIKVMQEVAVYLLTNIQNCRCAYVQSDEISLLLDDRSTLETDAWFGNKLQKLVSISASMATAYFNAKFTAMFSRDFSPLAVFDSRAFILPDKDVANYFIWRQRDWNRNSIQMFARSMYSQKQLHGKNTSDMHEMMHEKGKNWAKLEPYLKNGSLFINRKFQHEISYFDKFDYEKFNELLIDPLY